MVLALSIVAAAGPALSQSATTEGQKLAFDRGKGNCLTCHVIKGGEYPGTLGPELIDIKSKYPNRDNFLWTDPRPDTTAKPCMSGCVDPADIKIASTAEGKKLTPRTTGPLDTMQVK